LLKITRGKRSLLEKQSFLCLGCLSEATLLWNLPDAKQREPFSRLSSDISLAAFRFPVFWFQGAQISLIIGTHRLNQFSRPGNSQGQALVALASSPVQSALADTLEGL
jgi:hypothetical protein